MDHLTKDDLAQLDRSYLQRLEKETVIDVACKLRDFSITLVERLEQNSSNSSKPPSSDDPYAKANKGDSDSKDVAECSNHYPGHLVAAQSHHQ